MDGALLWKLFLDARVPTGDLKALGYDLYWVRNAPHTQESLHAVTALGRLVEIPADFAYQAFNIDPGRSVLQQLADDYQKSRSWGEVAASTSIYINRVAQRVTIIKNAQKKTQGPAASAPPRPAAAPSPAPTSKVSTYVALAFSILACNEIIKFAAYRWKKRLTAAH